MTHERAYEILGISPNTPLKDAKKAYRTLAKVHHPDKNPTRNAGSTFHLVQEAWKHIQDDLEEEEVEAAEVTPQDKTESEFKKAIEKQRQLYKEAMESKQPEWNTIQRAYEAYRAHLGNGTPPIIELQGPGELSDGNAYYGVDDLRCNRSYKKMSFGEHDTYICQSKSQADEILIDGLNCSIQLYPISLERIVLLRDADDTPIYKDGIYNYIKTRQFVRGELRNVYMHLQYKIKDTHNGVFPDLIHGVNAIILERDASECTNHKSVYDYIKKCSISPASKWINEDRPETLPEGLPRVAFRIKKYRKIEIQPAGETRTKTILQNNFPYIYHHPIEMPDAQELLPHKNVSLFSESIGWRASWKKETLMWPDGVERDTYRRLFKERDGDPPKQIDPLTLTGDALDEFSLAKYPDLVDGLNCHVRIFD